MRFHGRLKQRATLVAEAEMAKPVPMSRPDSHLITRVNDCPGVQRKGHGAERRTGDDPKQRTRNSEAPVAWPGFNQQILSFIRHKTHFEYECRSWSQSWKKVKVAKWGWKKRNVHILVWYCSFWSGPQMTARFRKNSQHNLIKRRGGGGGG